MKFLLLIPTMMLILCCNNNTGGSKSLFGKWRPVDVNFRDMSEADKKDVLETASIELMKDSSYVSVHDKNKKTGTYTVRNGQLITRSTDDSEEKFTINWDGNKLLLSNSEGSITLKKE
jgi:hypothetical protein